MSRHEVKGYIESKQQEQEGSNSNAGFQAVEKKASKFSKNMLKKCQFCATVHIWGADRCPAFGKTCGRCLMRNHFTDACRRKQYRILSKSQSLHTRSTHSNNDFEYEKRLIQTDDELQKCPELKRVNSLGAKEDEKTDFKAERKEK